MGNKKIIFFTAFMLFIAGCSSIQKSELSEAENLKAKEFLARIYEINASSPDTLSSSFTADGNTGEKKFRVEGRAAFDKKGYYKLTILDYVFQSPVMEAYRELEKLYFYYPLEKRLLIDDAGKIDLSVYTGFKTDYRFAYTLLTGGIPLPEKYTVYKCLYDEKEKGYFLILENSDYFENIFFRDDVPEKILIMHKMSRDKSEIYLKSIIRKDKSIFFKKCRIVIPEMNSSININFIKPVINKAVNVDKLKQEKLPKNIEIVRVN